MSHHARHHFSIQAIAIAAIATFVIVSPAEQSQAGLLTSASEAQLEAWLGGGDRVFTNIYTKASGHTAADFHAAADGKGPTISLMQIVIVEGSASDPDVGQIIGGYNPQSWASSHLWHFTPNDTDRTAFIFNLSTGVKLDQRLGSAGGNHYGQYQTYNHANWGPVFGIGRDAYAAYNLTNGSVTQRSYGNPAGGHTINGTSVYGKNLLGDSYTSHRSGIAKGKTEVTYGQIEVFTFSDVQASGNMVPEPTSLAVFCVMGLAGCLRRRRVE